MGLYRKAAAAYAPANAYRKEGGAWVLKQAYKKVAGAWTLMTASVTPTPSTSSISALDTTAVVTTGAMTVTATGGSGSYSYAWTKQSGGSIVANSPGSATSTFKSGTNMTVGEERTAIMRCTVTDTVTHETGFVDVTVTLDRVAAPSISLSTPSLTQTDITSSESTGSITATGTGGTAPLNYKWTRVSGAGSTSSTGIAVSNSTATTVNFTSSGLSAGESRSAIWQCTVTDANGITASAQVSVTISRASALSASATPSTLTGSGTTATITTSSSVTAAASGGAGPYDYVWSKVSGGAITAASAGSAGTKFTATGMANGESRSAVFKCTITDSLGQVASTANVPVTITNTAATGATYSPAAGSYSAGDTDIVSYTVTASASVPWTWSATNTAGLSASLASGASGTSIQFTLDGPPSADISTTITLNSGGQSWTINLTSYHS